MPYPDHRINENVFFENSPRYPLRQSLPDRDMNYEKSVASSLERLQNKLFALNPKTYKSPIELSPDEVSDPLPDFTYHFDEPRIEERENTFAAKPNDPRYYEKVEHVTRREEHPRVDEDVRDKHPRVDEDVREKHPRVDEDVREEQQIGPIEDSRVTINEVMNPQVPIFKDFGTDIAESVPDQNRFQNDRVVEIMPEPQRRAEKEPIITFTRSKVNNDVYFIGE